MTESTVVYRMTTTASGTPFAVAMHPNGHTVYETGSEAFIRAQYPSAVQVEWSETARAYVAV